jgi:small subunit ribosomal protein S4
MARYTGSRNKLARQIGEDLGLKSNALKTARRIGVRPGQHGAKGRRKLSDYAVQLKEKQKLKYIYGILEKQLRRQYAAATASSTSTGETLLSLLERRLDNVVYRMGWAPTRAAARQIVSHGHVTVNNKRMDVPSYQVKVNDVVVLDSQAANIPYVAVLISDEVAAPSWLSKKATVGKVERLPERVDIAENVEVQLVVEYYSR